MGHKSKIIHLDLKNSKSLQIGPSSEQEHKFGQADVFPFRPPDEARFCNQTSVGPYKDIKVAEGKLVDVLEHAHAKGVPSEVGVGSIGLGLVQLAGVLHVQGLPEHKKDQQEFLEQPQVYLLDQQVGELGHDHVNGHNLDSILVHLIRLAPQLLPTLGLVSHVAGELGWEHAEHIVDGVGELFFGQVAAEGVEHTGQHIVGGC